MESLTSVGQPASSHVHCFHLYHGAIHMVIPDAHVPHRQRLAKGGFNHAASSELPIDDVPNIVIESAARDLIDPTRALDMALALMHSIERQQRTQG